MGRKDPEDQEQRPLEQADIAVIMERLLERVLNLIEKGQSGYRPDCSQHPFGL